jgi:hypothetical protein
MRQEAGMATAVQAQPQRRLDDLVIEAIAAFQSQPMLPAAKPSDAEISIQVVRPPVEDEIAVTTQFVRLSAPYERVELDFAAVATPRKRRTTFVKTIRARETVRDIIVPSLPQLLAAAPAPAPANATQAFEAVWFDKSEDSLSRMLAAEQDRRKRGWTWLAISLAVALIATLALV